MCYLNDYVESWSQEAAINGNMVTETDINDFLWFDAFDILVENGYVDEDMNWADENN